MARIGPSLVAALAAICLALLTLGPTPAGAHSHARTRHSSCGRSASFHARHPGRHIRGCARGHRKRSAIHHRHGGRSSQAACAGAGAMPTEANLDLIRGAVVCLENRERQAQGESPLRVNADLQAAAQAHSEDMVSHRYFDHAGPDGTPLQRMRAAGYISDPRAGYEVGENLAWGTLWLATPRAIVAGWMASSGHRANILDSRFRDTAVGVAVDLPRSFSGGQQGGMYTQDFGVVSGR